MSIKKIIKDEIHLSGEVENHIDLVAENTKLLFQVVNK